MMNYEYSPFKALRHRALIRDIRHRAGMLGPAQVHWVLSDLCNQSCNFCSYRTPGYPSAQNFYTIDAGRVGALVRDPKNPSHNYNPKRWIPTDRALRLVQELADTGVRAVQFTGGGEPTVHPDFKQIVAATRAAGLEYAVVSNGSLVLGKELAQDFAQASWCRISVDAGYPQTYAHNHGVKQTVFEQVWEGIREIVRARKALCTIGVAFTVTPHNWREIVYATDLARTAGADNIRISAMFSNEGAKVHQPYYEAARQLCHEAKNLARTGFQVFDRFGERLSDLEQQNPDYPKCWYQHFTSYIGADQNVYRCCVYSYNDRGLVGNLANQTFTELWRNKGRQQEMLDFNARNCARCMFNGNNRLMDYVLREDEPPHANFV